MGDGLAGLGIGLGFGELGLGEIGIRRFAEGVGRCRLGDGLEREQVGGGEKAGPENQEPPHGIPEVRGTEAGIARRSVAHLDLSFLAGGVALPMLRLRR